MGQTNPKKTDKPVVLRKYRDMPEAAVDKSVLEAAGIACELFDENTVRMDWLWSKLLGGVKLVMRESEAKESVKILSDAWPQDGEDAAGK